MSESLLPYRAFENIDAIKRGEATPKQQKMAWIDFMQLLEAKDAERAEQPEDTPTDVRAIVERLGFDPTNHHNAAKCPYCCLSKNTTEQSKDSPLLPFPEVSARCDDYDQDDPRRAQAFLNWSAERIARGEPCCHYHKDFSMHTDSNSWGYHEYRAGGIKQALHSAPEDALSVTTIRLYAAIRKCREIALEANQKDGAVDADDILEVLGVE